MRFSVPEWLRSQWMSLGQTHIDRALALSFLITIAGLFFVDPSLRRVIIYVFAPLGLFFLWKEQPWKSLFQEKIGAWLLSAYILLSVASVGWSLNLDADKAVDGLKLLILVPYVLLVFYGLILKTPDLWKKLLQAFVISAAVTGIILLINEIPRFERYMDTGRLTRMRGMGSVGNSNSAGMMYGLALMLGCVFLPSLKQYKKQLIAAVAGLAVILMVVILTGSRVAALGVIGTALFMLLLHRQYRVLAVLALIGAIAAVSLFVGLDFNNSAYMERGSSGRFDLWAAAAAQIAERPFFGYGIASEFEYLTRYGRDNETYSTVVDAHSLYLDTAVEVGLVGLALLLALIGRVLLTLRAYRPDWAVSSLYAMIVFGLVFGLFDTNGYFHNLNIYYMVSWFPLMAWFALKQSQSLSGRV